MSPTIRIWAISGPLGMVVSGLITALMVAVGAITVQSAEPDCNGVGFGECLGQVFGRCARRSHWNYYYYHCLFSSFLLSSAWFLTGMFAGWQSVRHIRRLEPGITSGQSRGVSLGWGCGAIVAAVAMIVVAGIISNVLGL